MYWLRWHYHVKDTAGATCKIRKTKTNKTTESPTVSVGQTTVILCSTITIAKSLSNDDRKSTVFSWRRNVVSDGAFLTDDGRLFHAQYEDIMIKYILWLKKKHYTLHSCQWGSKVEKWSKYGKDVGKSKGSHFWLAVYISYIINRQPLDCTYTPSWGFLASTSMPSLGRNFLPRSVIATCWFTFSFSFFRLFTDTPATVD